MCYVPRETSTAQETVLRQAIAFDDWFTTVDMARKLSHVPRIAWTLRSLVRRYVLEARVNPKYTETSLNTQPQDYIQYRAKEIIDERN